MWEKSNFLMCFNTFFKYYFQESLGKKRWYDTFKNWKGSALLNVIFLSSLSLNLLCTSYILAFINV